MDQDAKKTALRTSPDGIGVLGAVECRAIGITEQGDHYIVVAEVPEAHLPNASHVRPDAAILEMKGLGDKFFYGG